MDRPAGECVCHAKDLEENVIKEISPNSYDDKTKDGKESAMSMTQMTNASESITPMGGQSAFSTTQTETSSRGYSRSSMIKRQMTAQDIYMTMTA